MIMLSAVGSEDKKMHRRLPLNEYYMLKAVFLFKQYANNNIVDQFVIRKSR